KLTEETRELMAARQSADQSAIEDEFGDLLFVMVNIGRHLGVDPEAALRSTNAKFTRRFEYIETALDVEGRTPNDASLEDMDTLWTEAKSTGL
ncbi:MAG: MazG nucleotide pyrophosphohydrolase domain-containing protein, partial [Pseudomonadota bacterium]